MATFYIQLEDRLQKISGDLTVESITRALGYTPSNFSGSFNDLSDNPLIQDDKGEFTITDEVGNIIGKVTNEGFISIDFISGEHKLTEKANVSYVDEKFNNIEIPDISFDSLEGNPFTEDDSGELNISDNNGNIIVKVNNEGVLSTDFTAGVHKLTEKADKTEIPTKNSELENDSQYATEEYVNDKFNSIEIPEVDFTGYATEEYVNTELNNLDFYSIKNNPVINSEDGKLLFVDENGNIGLQLEADNNLYVKDVIAGDNVLSNKVDKIQGKGLSTEDFTTTLKNKLESLNNFDSTEIENSINNTNIIITNAISDNSISPTELTTIINAIAVISNNVNDMKNTLLDTAFLGSRGTVISNLLTINKTAVSFNQTMTEIEEEIDGETGLKATVNKHSTSIEQTARELNLKYMKYDKTTAQLTVGDDVIKLDAGKVLLTGTLTWDTLDEIAKNNLKGEDGSAEYVMLTGDQIFKYDNLGNPVNTEITLATQISNISSPTFKWYYKFSNEWVEMNNTASSFTLTHNDDIWGGLKKLTIRVQVNYKYYDEITVVKLYDGIDGIDGTDGENARYVKVNGEQVFKVAKDGSIFPENIVLYGEKYNFTSTQDKWYYKNADGEWIDLNKTGSTSLLVSHNSPAFIGDTANIKYEVNTHSDVITLSKLYDGENGQSGFTVILSNENVTIPCDKDGNYEESDLHDAYTTIYVYEGLVNLVDFAVQTVDTGCKSHYNQSTKSLIIDSVSSVFAKVDINITVKGNTFAKTFTISKALQGETGKEGNGIQIIGQLDSIDELPELGGQGDAYLINGLIYVWSITNNRWADGVPFRGEQGIPGKDGIDGKTSYIHIKYSDDGVKFTSNNGKTIGKWMGQYTDFIKEDSQIFSDYTWVKVMGDDGEHGIVANLSNDNHTIPCDSKGTPLSSAYTGCESKITLSYNGNEVVSGVDYSYVKSSSISGTWSGSEGKYTVTGLSSDTGYIDFSAMYNGIRYTKRFTVSKNCNGEDTYIVNLSNDGHSFTADSDGNIIGGNSTTIEVYAYKGGKTATPTIGTLPTVTGISMSKSSNKITIVASSSMAQNGTINIPITVDGVSFTKKFSYSKVTCGADGADGADGYTVLLSNENEMFNCDYQGNIKSNITVKVKVQAFKGTQSVTPTIGTLPSVTGLQISKSGTVVTVVAVTGTSLASMGSFEIPVKVDGLTFNKTFKWCKVFAGKDGDMNDIPSWISDWNGTVTSINGTTVLAPKIFAGTVSNNVPTGVAIGKNVFGTSGTYSNVNGIVGYKSGTKRYEFNVSGDILIGDLNGEYISWTSSGLKINSKNILLNSKGVATSSQLTATESGILSTVSSTYATKTQLNGVNNSLNTVSSTVSQTADKISWIVKSGTSASSMQLTDRAYQLISQNITLTGSNITLTASNIKLEGYVSANSNFKIDTSGNLIAKNGQFSGTISGTTISGGTISGTTISGSTIKGASIIGGKFENSSGTFQVDGNSGAIMVGMPLDEGTYITENGIYFYDSLIEYSAIKRGRFYLYDDNNNGKAVGYLGRNKWKGTDNYLTVINAETNHTVALGAKYASDTTQYTCPIIVSAYNGKINSSFYVYEGLNISSPHTTGIQYYHKNSTSSESYPGYVSGSGSYGLCVTGPSNGLRIRCQNGSSIHACMVFSIDTNQANNVYADAYHPINMHNYRIYNSSVTSSSDRTLKENIKYLNYQNINPNASTIDEDDISLDDMYNFINNDYLLASYNYINEDTSTISAIAQDLLINLDGSDNKVGQLITKRTKGICTEVIDPQPTEKDKRSFTPLEDITDEEEEVEAEANEVTSEILGINQTELLNVTIGALQKACQEIEILKAKVQELESK